MSELSVRETAARAIYETEPLPGVPTWDRLASESDEWPLSLARVETKRRYSQADAVLAAVAAHDGLTDVLRTVLTAHGVDDVGGIHSWRCFLLDRYGPCTCLDELTKDLADVVRAWLRGES